MSEMFPMMIERPEDRTIVSGFVYWPFAFLVFPFLTLILSIGAQDPEYVCWMEIIYHVCNGVVVLPMFASYLKDAFLTVQLQPKRVAGIAAVCAAVIVVLKLTVWALGALSGSMLFFEAAAGSLITSEMDLLFYSSAVLDIQPLWGGLIFVLVAPFVTSCLYYACGFATIGVNRPKLAYLVMAGLLLIPRLLMAFCLWPIQEEMALYLIQLPVHLIACWAYQKTDTIWTPILVHFFSNLATTLLVLYFIATI